MVKVAKIWFPLALAVSAASAVPAQAAGQLPLYPGATARPFQGRLEANLAPIEAIVLETSDDLEKVLDFYRKSFEPQGKNVVEHHFDPALAYIGFFDQQTESMRMVTVMRMPQGVTWVILSGMDPRPLINPMQVPEGLPAVTGAEDVVVTASKGRQGGEGSSVSFTVRGKAPEETRGELLKSARSLGWHLLENGMAADKNLLTFRRGKRICTAQLLQLNSDPARPVTGVSLVVFETESPK